MLYFLGQLGDSLAAFNVFRYITFRTVSYTHLTLPTTERV